MTMTLEQVRDYLRCSMYEDLKGLADAIDAHLPQPQPVAEGEAAGESYVKCVRCHGKGMADIYVGSTGGSFDQPPDPVFERDACPECEGACFVPATPTIPTGHRIVPVETFGFIDHLQRQRDWSGKTFGPGSRAQGVVDHIRKELMEIEADPSDLKEWIDVAILALDGAWRSGATPEEIVDALVSKQTKNEGRVWPDWRTADPTKAIEHDRTHDAGGV